MTRIPTATLQEGNRVLVFDAASEKLVSRTVKPGLANWEYTEVLEGLAPGERIVVSLDKEGVKAGVRVIEESGAEKK